MDGMKIDQDGVMQRSKRLLKKRRSTVRSLEFDRCKEWDRFECMIDLSV